MKLFQIEEPDGSPVDPDAPGVAIGIDCSGEQAEVAVAVGGNAVVLTDRDGFPLDLGVPPITAPSESWRHLFEGTRLRAERGLAQPVTHAVVILRAPPDAGLAAGLLSAAEAAGLVLLRIAARGEVADTEPAAHAAAILAEDIAPTPVAP